MKKRDKVLPGVTPRLTEAQMRVLVQVCNGHSLKEIAKSRNCTVPTVKHHLSVIMMRWGVTRSEQVYPAILKWAGEPSPADTVRRILPPPVSPAK